MLRESKNKTVVIFWGRRTHDFSIIPIPFGEKSDTYLSLMSELEKRGVTTYLCRGYNNYLGEMKFFADWVFASGKLKTFADMISVDFVYDRSGGVEFPTIDIREVLNDLQFKILCINKWQTYCMFREYFPKSFLVSSPDDLGLLRESFCHDEKLVSKPLLGMKGKGISFHNINDLEGLKNSLSAEENGKLIVQEVVDSSSGIPGVIKSSHDLRLVYVGESLVWSHVRSPQPGGLLANVAQGGTISEVELDRIPTDLIDFVNPIVSRLNKYYRDPVFSVDLCRTDSSYKVFELNDRIGFPHPDMKNAKRFVEALADRIALGF